MGSNKTTLGELVKLIRGNTYKSKLLSETEGPVLLGLGSIQRNGGFKYGAWKHYPGESDARILLHPGDIYVSLKDLTQACDLLGAVSRVPEDIPEGRLTQDTVKLDFYDINDLEKQYVYWSLRTPQYRAYCKARGTGTTNMSLSRDDFLAWRIPEHCERNDALVALFEDIEAKVRNNQQTNDYLEELGSALIERYIACCDETILLKELLDFGNGFAFKSGTYVDNGKYKVLTIKNVQDGNVDCSGANRIDEIPDRMKEFCRLNLGDVVLSLTGNVGRVGIVSEPDCLLNQRVAVFLPNAERALSGLYFWFRQDAFKDRMIGIARGTAQANLSPIETLQLEIPFNEDGFAELCIDAQPFFDAILANKKEMMVLANLRDTLLPKLMSGEIDVSQVELPTQPNNHLQTIGVD